MKGEQAQHVIGDIKHYALNDQESGRNAVNVNINERAMRETDLLAFEIGLRESECRGRDVLLQPRQWRLCLREQASAHRCSEERLEVPRLCPVRLARHAQHRESLRRRPRPRRTGRDFSMATAFKKAVESGQISMAELDDHVHRILRSMFASGVVDDPPQKSVVDVEGGFEVAQKIAEQSIVLLQNENGQLPLDASKLHSIAVIGAHADVGMISGGGSAQVDPPGGNAIMPPGKGQTRWLEPMWFPTSPLKTIRAKVPQANVQYDAGSDPAAAAAVAKKADVAIVFAYQWESEGMDLDSLTPSRASGRSDREELPRPIRIRSSCSKPAAR